MPRKDGRFTPAESKFIAVFVDTGDRAKAEKAAGLAPRGGYHVMARPAVAAEIGRQQIALAQECGTLAVGRLRGLLLDPKTQGGTLTKAIELGFKASGLGEERAQAVDMSEMTPAQLAALIEEGERLKAGLAKPVEAREVEPGQAGVFD